MAGFGKIPLPRNQPATPPPAERLGLLRERPESKILMKYALKTSGMLTVGELFIKNQTKFFFLSIKS